MRFLKAFLLPILLVPLACSRTELIAPPAPETPQQTPSLLEFIPADLVGTWLLESGTMIPDFIGGLATYSVTADVTAIRIGDDGTGDVWIRDRITGTKDCIRAFVVFDDDDATLVFDFAAETVTDVVYNLAIEQYTYIFPVISVDATGLRLADEQGRIGIFSRQVTLPSTVTCAQLSIIARYDGLPAPQYYSDMAMYEGDLMYASSTDLERFSPTNHTLGTPFGSTSSRLVQTSNGNFFWTHCGCGGSRDAYERTLQAVFDTVSSEDEMGGAITFRAMAYVPTTDRLWIHGRPFDTQFGSFYVMNTNGEPDLIEQQFSFNRDLRALAFDGSDLWGIVTVATQTVIRIDPATATVIESYEVPDVDVSWSGLEFAPDGMYMLGTDAAGSGVMIRMTAPSTVTAVPPPVTASGDLLLESVESSGAKPVSIAAPMSASLHR